MRATILLVAGKKPNSNKRRFYHFLKGSISGHGIWRNWFSPLSKNMQAVVVIILALQRFYVTLLQMTLHMLWAFHSATSWHICLSLTELLLWVLLTNMLPGCKWLNACLQLIANDLFHLVPSQARKKFARGHGCTLPTSHVSKDEATHWGCKAWHGVAT